MARFVITATTSVTLVPSSFDSANSNNNTVSNPNNGLKSYVTTTSYAAFYNVKGAEAESWAYYNFECSGIPRNAIINSVSCKFRAKTYSKSTDVMHNNYGQLSIGTEKVGTSAATFTTDIYLLPTTDSGDYVFSREDLDNIKLYLHSQRGTKNQNSQTVYYQFYGADLTINYSTGYYEYDITVSSQTEYATVVQSAYTVSSGGNVNVDIQISNKPKVVIEDNSDDVTSAFTLVNGTTYRYQLVNVNEDHNIIVLAAPNRDVLYFKNGNQWIQIKKIYKKQSNTWVEQDLTYVLNNDFFN